jgi:hypothetical protein
MSQWPQAVVNFDAAGLGAGPLPHPRRECHHAHHAHQGQDRYSVAAIRRGTSSRGLVFAGAVGSKLGDEGCVQFAVSALSLGGDGPVVGAAVPWSLSIATNGHAEWVIVGRGSAANTDDAEALKPLIRGMPAIRGVPRLQGGRDVHELNPPVQLHQRVAELVSSVLKPGLDLHSELFDDLMECRVRGLPKRA